METEQQTQKLPLKDLVFYVVVANMSIIGLNVSLMLNTIGFYQVCKLRRDTDHVHIRGVVFEQEIFQEGCASDHRRFGRSGRRDGLGCGDEYCRDDCSERRGVEHIRALKYWLGTYKRNTT